jgi:hypothetical protein
MVGKQFASLPGMTTVADRWGRGLFFAAIVSALAVCIPAVQGQPLAMDEHGSHFVSAAPTVAELWTRTSEDTAVPALSHLLERAALAINNHSENTFRMPSLLAFLTAVLVSFWLGKEVGGPACGGLTAFLIAWHPEVIDEVRFARCYGLILCLSALSSWLMFRVLKEPSLRRLAVWALSAAGLIWTHYLAVLLIAMQSGILLISIWTTPRSRRRRMSLAIAFAIIGVGLSGVPLMPAVLRLSEWGQAMDYRRSSAGVFEAVGARWFVPALLLIVAAGVVRLVAAWKGATSTKLNLSIWPLLISLLLWLPPLAVLAYMAVAQNPMLAVPRYRVMLAPPAALAISLALVRAVSMPISTGAAAILLTGTLWLTGVNPGKAGRLSIGSDEEWKKAGIAARAWLAEPGTMVFAQTGLGEAALVPLFPDDDRFLKYVASRLGSFYTRSEKALPIPLMWDGAGPLHRNYAKRLSVQAVHDVQIVGAADTDLNRDSIKQFAQFVESCGFKINLIERRPGIEIRHFQRE